MHTLPFSYNTISEIHTHYLAYMLYMTYIHTLTTYDTQIYITCDIYMYTHVVYRAGTNTIILLLGYILIASLQFKNFDTKTIREATVCWECPMCYSGTSALRSSQQPCLWSCHHCCILQVISREKLEYHRVIW